jgi:hypothetical protein
MRFRTACLVLPLLIGATAAAAGSPDDLDFLIGEWNVGPPDAPAAFVERFEWGPKRSYIWTTTSLYNADGSRRVHFEGMIVWNAANKEHDYLFVVEPGSQTQEQGVYRREAEDRLVRTVTLTGPDGVLGEFRQTFVPAPDGTVETSLLRKTQQGWSPTFPGSERLIMRKNAAG